MNTDINSEAPTIASNQDTVFSYPETTIKKGKEYIPLKFICTNARDLRNKYTNLQTLFEDENPDVVAITETFLDESISSTEFTPEGFQCFRKDRNINFYRPGTYVDSNRGGVLLLVRSDLNPILSESSKVEAELLWVNITLHSRAEWLLGVCYRPEVDEEYMLHKIKSSIDEIDNQNVILLGDFNFRNINWRNNTCARELEQSFINCIEDNLLTQIVDEPTRGRNILDLAFVGDLSAVDDYEIIDPLGNSDHKSVVVNIKCVVPRVARSHRKVYLYSKGDYDNMNQSLKETDWGNTLNDKDLNANWKIFKQEYQDSLDRFVPAKMVKPGQRLGFPWTRYRSVKKAKIKCRKAKVKARISKLNADEAIAQRLKQDVDTTIEKAKSHYEEKLVTQIKDEPKRFYNYARHFSKTSSSIDVLENEGAKITDDAGKAEVLNDFFSSVLTDETPLDSTHYHANDNKNPKNILRDIEFTVDDVRKKLASLKANKASGPDAVNVNVMRQCLDMDVPLHILFTQSIRTGITPQDWRDANITPLFKKGSRSKANNYRPVSLTSQVVKLLERLVYDHILNNLKINGTISCHQHGFQDQCSCVSQLLECFQDWSLSYDNAIQTDIIYLDFAKAFDTVPHKRLLLKLKNVGIRGRALKWLESFLTNRRQRVILRNGSSTWNWVKSGVPQGSILGPLLFLVYVNDMPDVISSTAKMFADDTKVYREIRIVDDCYDLQKDLNSLSAWSQKWLLRFNATKCVVLKIKLSFQYMYTLNGHFLDHVSTQKDLGITVSDDLKSSIHIANIVKKNNQKIGMFKRCFSSLSKDGVLILYKSIIRPTLEYASPAWSPYLKKDIDLLENAQRRCLKLCNEGASLPTLKHRRLFTDMCEVYKYTHMMYKNGLTDMFTFSNVQLRGHPLKLDKKYSRTQARSGFFAERVVNVWNSLPESVVTAPSLPCFKSRLKRVLPEGEED